MSLQAEAPRLVLASASAARAGLLRAAGLRFTVQAAAIDETAVKQAAAADRLTDDGTALLLAELKAARVAARPADDRAPDDMIIGCDQLLVCEGRRFDKPGDQAEAREQLQGLRGHTHILFSAVVCLRGGQRVWHHVARPRLAMRDMSDDFIDAYLAAEGDAVLACVGAYRLEGLGVQLFDRVEGEHAAILGLPLLPLLGFLRQHGVLAR
jgi:septum formation protein